MIFTTAYMANYIEDNFGYNSWKTGIDILRFNFLLIFISLRDGVKKLIGSLFYRILIYILINNFIDIYFGYTTWSWNDFLTVFVTIIEYCIEYRKHKKLQHS
jgi:hypothetical protein